MKQSEKPIILCVRDAETLREFLKEAKQVWRGAHPDRRRAPGRPSQREADRYAIAEIAKGNASISGPSVKLWTQNEWVKKIGAFREQSVPGQVTIRKNLKNYIERTVLPLNLIPASTIQNKPLGDQLHHWYAVAIAEAVVSDYRPSPEGRIHIPHERLNAIHRELCRKHIRRSQRRSQITEPRRQAWFDRQWARTRSVPLESRKSPISPPSSRKPLTDT